MNRERERPMVGVGGGVRRLGVDVWFVLDLEVVGVSCLFVCLIYIDTCQFLILVCFLSRLLCFLI